MISRVWWVKQLKGRKWVMVQEFAYQSDAQRWAGEMRRRTGGRFKVQAHKLAKNSATKRVNRKPPRKNAARKKNPLKIAATMSGKSTGWMAAKAVRVRTVNGKRVVDVKK